MDETLPGGSDSSLSLFEKIKEKLSGVPAVFLAFLAVLFATLVLGGFYILLSPNVSLKSLLEKLPKIEQPQEVDKNIWEPAKPTPQPLAHGKQTYAISGSKKGAPKATEVVIDPLDPALSATQSGIVKVLSMEAGPVTKVSIQLITDNKTKTYPLKLTSGTNLDGEWSGTWVMEDSYDYKYQMAVIAENAKDAWSITLTFR